MPKKKSPRSKNATNGDSDPDRSWFFLSNHTHVLLCISQDPDILLRELAYRVGITERAVQRIIGEAENAGYLRRYREGRRNTYELELDRDLRHPLSENVTLRHLLEIFPSEA